MAYKLKADASFPRPIRKSKRSDGETFWEVEGITYDAGSIITEDFMTEHDRKRAKAGELSHLLELVDETAPVETEETEEKNPFLNITQVDPSEEKTE